MPHPDPSGGQAPRLAKSSTALHFLIPPSAIGLQLGTFRPWRAGIEVDWRAHPGSESGTCFHSTFEARSIIFVPIAHAGTGAGTPNSEKPVPVFWYSELALSTDSATPHCGRVGGPTPEAGDKPPRYILPRVPGRDAIGLDSSVESRHRVRIGGHESAGSPGPC